MYVLKDSLKTFLENVGFEVLIEDTFGHLRTLLDNAFFEVLIEGTFKAMYALKYVRIENTFGQCKL